MAGLPDSAPQSLRERLPHYDASAARTLARITAADRALVISGVTWRCTAPYPVPGLVRLDGEHGPLGVHVAQTEGAAPSGARHWSDYDTAEARVLAWTLQHEALLQHLGALLGGAPPLPVECDCAEDTLPAAGVAFSVVDGEGRRWRGQLRSSDAQLRALAEHPGWASVPRAVPLAAPAVLSVSLVVCMPLAEWHAAGPGDVLVVGPRATALQRLQLVAADGRRWSACGEARRLTLGARRGPHDPVTGSPSMHAEPQPAGAPADPSESLQPPAMELSFELCTLTLPVAELEHLQPGSMLTLPTTLDDAGVVVRSAGRAIARGRLVAVGDTLGVQLTELPD